MTENASPDPERLRDALRAIPAPGLGRDIVAAGLVEGLTVRGGLVQLVLRAERANAAAMERVRAEAETLLAGEPGVRHVAAVLTSHRAAPDPEPHPAAGPKFLAGVRRVIAVGSGKGGVGKSTVAVNLAAALAARGLAVGLIDADIYGPSLPRMLGTEARPEVRDRVLQPVIAWGMKTMSIGFLVPGEEAMVWRGPMVMGALQQMLGQTNWGTLDAMVVDLPPGTGDVPLTLAQRTRLAGAVIVSTPQDVALADARRGVGMFRKVDVPVLGIVENMSGFACPHCGTVTPIFGAGGAEAEAARLGIPFLGGIPLLPALRESGDAGRPAVIGEPEGAAAAAFRAIADRLWSGL